MTATEVEEAWRTSPRVHPKAVSDMLEVQRKILQPVIDRCWALVGEWMIADALCSDITKAIEDNASR